MHSELRIGNCRFEQLNSIDCDGIPSPVRVCPVGMSVDELADALLTSGPALLDFLEATEEQALWIVGLDRPIRTLDMRRTEIVEPNFTAGMNTLVHNHDATHLDIVNSVGMRACRSPFDFFPTEDVEAFVIAHWDEFVRHAHVIDNLSPMPEFTRGEIMGSLASFVVGQTLWNVYVRGQGKTCPEPGFMHGCEGAARAWRHVISTILRTNFGTGKAKKMMVLERELVPAQRVDWKRSGGHSCVVFRGFHRGNEQKSDLHTNGSRIQHTPLVLSSVHGPSWDYLPGWDENESWGEQ